MSWPFLSHFFSTVSYMTVSYNWILRVCNLVSAFLETKSVTKSRLHCMYFRTNALDWWIWFLFVRNIIVKKAQLYHNLGYLVRNVQNPVGYKNFRYVIYVSLPNCLDLCLDLDQIWTGLTSLSVKATMAFGRLNAIKKDISRWPPRGGRQDQI